MRDRVIRAVSTSSPRMKRSMPHSGGWPGLKPRVLIIDPRQGCIRTSGSLPAPHRSADRLRPSDLVDRSDKARPGRGLRCRACAAAEEHDDIRRFDIEDVPTPVHLPVRAALVAEVRKYLALKRSALSASPGGFDPVTSSDRLDGRHIVCRKARLVGLRGGEPNSLAWSR